jgi:hypothetical protein
MTTTESAQLRRIADLIDRFPRFIRRDKGGTSVQAAIKVILERHGINNPQLEADLEQLTADYRQTIATYYERQFGL